MTQRIAACLHADVNGYSRLIAADVRSTVTTLASYRTVITRMVARYNGRVVDTAGDSLLAEFASASSAVRCAVDIQRELEARNDALPPSRRLEFRIGIDFGDILVDGQRIYGDCVNIAARVQELATPGGICIAGSAYDSVTDSSPLRFDYLGERMVKNVDKPVRLYHVE